LRPYHVWLGERNYDIFEKVSELTLVNPYAHLIVWIVVTLDKLKLHDFTFFLLLPWVKDVWTVDKDETFIAFLVEVKNRVTVVLEWWGTIFRAEGRTLSALKENDITFGAEVLQNAHYWFFFNELTLIVLQVINSILKSKNFGKTPSQTLYKGQGFDFRQFHVAAINLCQSLLKDLWPNFI